MQAIQVKYLPATNTLPARVKAFTCAIKGFANAVNSDLSIEENMRDAAIELAGLLKWKGEYRSGHLPNGDMVWVSGKEDFFNCK